MKYLKILYIITVSDLGGAQIHLREIISSLPVYIKPYIIIGNKGWLSSELEKKSKVYIIDSIKREISFLHDIKAIYTVKKIVNKIKPDIIHCHSSKAGTIGRIVSKICNTPVIFTVHGWAFTEGVSLKKRFVFEKIERFLASLTDKIICVSEYDKNLALNVMPEIYDKLLVIHNGISDIKERTLKKRGKCLRIIMVARFAEPKDQKLLIDAVDELSDEGVDIRLSFLGNGPNYNKIKSYSSLKKYSKNIIFVGEKVNVQDYLSQNDVFVLTSNWEGFPISIIEAMRQGMPVIASDVGGVREAIREGETGYLIPKGDKKALKDKLKILYNDRRIIEQMGESAREFFYYNFTNRSMMKKILEVYSKYLKNN